MNTLKNLTLNIISQQIKSIVPDGVPVTLSFDLLVQDNKSPRMILIEPPSITLELEVFRYQVNHKPRSIAFYTNEMRHLENAECVVSVQYVLDYEKKQNR